MRTHVYYRPVKRFIFTMDDIETAIFNYDNSGAESTEPQHHIRCVEWRAIKQYLVLHSGQPTPKETTQ